MTEALWAIALLGVVNALTFAAFAWDKRRSQIGGRRLPEATLLNLALLGGSPAAKLAQHRLRHKSRKQPFARRLNTIVGCQVFAMLVVPVLLWSPAARQAAVSAANAAISTLGL